MDRARILVVDDEESLCEILQFNLEVEGYDVDVAYSAEQALDMGVDKYQLILLDVMMSGMSGFRMAQHLKRDPATAHIPIIFCTAKDTENDIVTGLNIGADDYIAKPFSIREVCARVNSVLRRNTPPSGAKGQSRLSFDNLVVDTAGKQCTVNGKAVQLTKKEFEILSLLLSDIGRIYSREEILARIWESDVVVLDRTIDVNITRLRKKIAPYGSHIVTRLGYGYGFEE